MFNKRMQKVAVAAGVGFLGFKVADSQMHISNDVMAASRLLPLVLKLKKLNDSQPSFTVADAWAETCKSNPSKECLVFAEDGSSMTFQEVDQASNRVGHYALGLGLKEGDVVALFMENRPEYIVTWLGLAKVGIVVALINSNNKQKPLMHSIDIAESKALFFGTELNEPVADVHEELVSRNLLMVSFGPNAPHFARDYMEDSANTPIDNISAAMRRNTGFDSPFGYIYTSGTTGLPKACVIKHSKYFSVGNSFHHSVKVAPNERLYTCLPLYHSAGGMLGAGCMLTTGVTLIISRKFSASRFFEECTKYNADVTQYIGELCRYLLNSKPTKWDRMHHLRIAIGNGLRREIWESFCDRFNIPEIGEFYGATEGNISFMNHYIHSTRQGVGAIGRAGRLMKSVLRFAIVDHDVANEVPVRNASGHCIPTPAGKVGELLGFIDESNAVTKFEGYTNKEATAKKVATDVFTKGDKYFRTGDLVRQDPDGFLYFADRIGDTFRWKGENVSTNEVSEVMSVLDDIHEANVYGVKIPGNEDGRACMAALVTENSAVPNMDRLAQTLFKNLASYAIPLFVRILPQMDITGTFKHRKVDFVKDSFDITKVQDPIFFLNLKTKSYEPLTLEKYQDIIGGHARL